jgi:hypothetical protein
LNTEEWQKLKQQGSEHYKTGDVEPIDLYVAGNMFHDKACSDIIKYAYRSRREMKLETWKMKENMDKVIDMAQKLMAFYGCENKGD